jgi:hypothetical protein
MKKTRYNLNTLFVYFLFNDIRITEQQVFIYNENVGKMKNIYYKRVKR